uniref:LRRCT domain-containing protein n=1 Tax=Strigamia maritima TaxID=126957 RepID=T1JLY8_STRMM
MKICPALPPCTCHRHQTRSYVVCSSVRNVSTLSAAIPRAKSDNLPWIRIVDSNIPWLHSRAFGGLRAQSLQINASNLTNITSDAFIGLENLEALALQDNLLYSIPAASLRRLVDLKLLSFAGNRIGSVSNEDLISLINLRYLSLSENIIDQIETGSFPPSLLHLALAKNQLESLDNVVADLPLLEWLLLSNNKLHTLEMHQFKSLPSLRKLILTNNQLEMIEGAFDGLTKLRELMLNNNKIRSVEDVFHFMPDLRDIGLARNQITHLAYLGDLPMLNDIDLSENGMENVLVDAFEKTPGITRLNLSDNAFVQFPADALSPLASLVTLDLSRNKLESPIYITQLRLPTLKYLSLSGNKLISLPDNLFDSFPSLQELDVTFNLLTTFDRFTQFPLKILHLQGNPLRCDLNTMRALDEMEVQLTDRPLCTNAVLPISQEETN